MKFQFWQSIPFAVLLNLLLPGLGHIFWKEFLFGIFVFLIMLLAIALFFVSFLFSLPPLVYWVLFLLPVVFYFFSFIDLLKTIRQKRGTYTQSSNKGIVFIVIAAAFQIAVPGSPIGFAFDNSPHLETMSTNDFSPAFRRGDFVKTSRLAYSVELPFFRQAVYHRLPDRYDIVKFKDSDAAHRGVVIGLPGEEVEVVDGVIVVNGAPQLEDGITDLVLTGDCALTMVDGYSMLVATVYLGKIDRVYEIPLTEIVGKVSPLI